MSVMAMATLGCAGQYPLDRDMVGVVITVCARHEAGLPLLCLRLVQRMGSTSQFLAYEP